jgi:16S rRNA (uracil1498-N3)-methyltransferase
MRLHRIFTPAFLEPGATVELDDRAARYLGRVLRIRAGDIVVLFNGDGCDYPATIVQATKQTVSARVNEAVAATNESPLRIQLAQGIARGERMDFALQKAVELGVAAIQPLFCQRTEVKLSGPRLGKRLDHWRGVIVSACEQSGRAVLPHLQEPVGLDTWLHEPPPGARLVLRPEADATLPGLSRRDRVCLLIGPEGGLADREIAAAVDAGFTPVRLGPRVLRTETAGPAALAVLQTLWGDLGSSNGGKR